MKTTESGIWYAKNLCIFEEGQRKNGSQLSTARSILWGHAITRWKDHSSMEW
jgi:hypothetical protein